MGSVEKHDEVNITCGGCGKDNSEDSNLEGSEREW